MSDRDAPQKPRREPNGSETLRIKVTEEERARILDVARRVGITVSELMRHGVMALIADYRDDHAAVFSPRRKGLRVMLKDHDPGAQKGKPERKRDGC